MIAKLLTQEHHVFLEQLLQKIAAGISTLTAYYRLTKFYFDHYKKIFSESMRRLSGILDTQPADLSSIPKTHKKDEKINSKSCLLHHVHSFIHINSNNKLKEYFSSS